MRCSHKSASPDPRYSPHDHKLPGSNPASQNTTSEGVRHARPLGADDNPISAKTNGSSLLGAPFWLLSSHQGAIQSYHSGQLHHWVQFQTGHPSAKVPVDVQ
jgi:hypothetical protein